MPSTADQIRSNQTLLLLSKTAVPSTASIVISPYVFHWEAKLPDEIVPFKWRPRATHSFYFFKPGGGKNPKSNMQQRKGEREGERERIPKPSRKGMKKRKERERKLLTTENREISLVL